jgi:arylsulfatase A-like enzyme
MKHQWTEGSGPSGRRAGFVSGWLLCSAFLGLLIGIFEAWMLWTRPRVIPLLVPDVGWVIWFLAPLVDMIFFGLVGLGLGLIARRTRGREVLVAIEAGIAVTFVTLMVAWFHVEFALQPFQFGRDVQTPLTVFAVVFFTTLLLLSAVWSRLAGFSERWLRTVRKPLGWGLAVVTVAAVVGIGVFVAKPSFSGTVAQAAPPPSGAPNIVFITLDTVRADHVSAYGYSRPTTPNLDRFARGGVLFENAIAPVSWTLASHASMFTGLLPQQHGANWAVPLASSPWTLAEILQSRGYETAAFIGNSEYLEKGWGTAQGFETYDDDSVTVRHNFAQTLVGNAIIQPFYQTFWRFNWFDRRSAQQIDASVFRWYQGRPRRPFYLFINYFDAHDPYLASGAYDHRFGKAPMRVVRKLRFVLASAVSSHHFSPQEQSLLADSYDNCLASLDNQVGKLLNFFRQSPEWQNTIVIITSDHGEEFGRHGDYIHGYDLYRELLHVPLIIAGPGVPQDARINHVVGTRQLFSTILDLAGGGKTPFSRSSLARFWNPGFQPTSFDNGVVSQLVPYNDPNAHDAMISLTTPEWQYIEHRDGKQELYNWTLDPEEKNNLAVSPQDQATLESLHTRLVGLVSEATGPWRGMEYLGALGSVAGPSRLSFLLPQPLQPGNPENQFRIGIAQAYFRPQSSAPVRPSQSERDLMRSLPYQ